MYNVKINVTKKKIKSFLLICIMMIIFVLWNLPYEIYSVYTTQVYWTCVTTCICNCFVNMWYNYDTILCDINVNWERQKYIYFNTGRNYVGKVIKTLLLGAFKVLHSNCAGYDLGWKWGGGGGGGWDHRHLNGDFGHYLKHMQPSLFWVWIQLLRYSHLCKMNLLLIVTFICFECNFWTQIYWFSRNGMIVSIK